MTRASSTHTRAVPQARLIASARASQLLVFALCASGCASTPAPNPTTPEVVARPGELRMRDPGQSPAGAARLGELETVRAPAAHADARPAPPTRPVPAPAAPASAPLPPIRIAASATPRAFALRDGALVVPGGLILHNVPKGVAARSLPAADGGEVWELVDVRGRRLALLKAEAIRRGAHGDLLSRTSAARSVKQRSDWGGSRVKVVSDRFLGENHVYTIERRADGTAWIWSGLELGTCGSRC